MLAIGNDKGDLPGHMQPIGSHRPPEESIVTLSYVPDPVEFYEEYVVMQTPVLFKGAIAGTPALTKWSDDKYLRYKFTGGQQQSKMVSKISRSQDFIGISGFLWDFNLWISRFLWDLWDFYRIISVFYGNNQYFTEIIGINILLGISDLGFKQDFSSDFSICVQDFSLLRTPRKFIDVVCTRHLLTPMGFINLIIYC